MRSPVSVGKYKAPTPTKADLLAQIAAGRSGTVAQIVANQKAATAATVAAAILADPGVIYSPLPLPAPIGTASPGIVGTPTGAGSGSATITPLGGVVGTYGPPSPIDLSGQNLPLGLVGAVGASPAANAASDGWDYFRNTIETIATDAEISFEEITSSGLASGTAITLGEVGLGVTEGLGSLEVVGFSAALLLSEYAFGWVVTKVALLFPNPSIFGWRPLNFIVSGINNFGKSFESSARGLGHDLSVVFMQPVRQIMGLFQRLGNATASAHNKVAHVVNHTIPDAVSGIQQKAQTYTDQQIATLTTTEREAIARLRRDTTQAIADSASKVKSHDAAALAKVNHDLIVMLQGDESLLSQLATTVNVQIPLEIAVAVDKAVATENQRLTATASTLQSEIDCIQPQITSLTGIVSSNEAAIVTAQTNIAALQGQSTIDEQAIAAEQATIAQAQADIATSTTMISTLHDQITGISSTLAPVHAAQLLNTSQLAPFEIAGSVALPTIIAALSGQLTKLQTKVDTCVVTTCDPASPNNIKNQIKDWLGMLSAAGELAFIAEAVQNPQGTADTLAPELNLIDSGAVDTLNALLSL